MEHDLFAKGSPTRGAGERMLDGEIYKKKGWYSL